VNVASISSSPVEPLDRRMAQGPLVRIALDGGCGLPVCTCSDEPYICVSDGQTCISVRLEPGEVAQLRALGNLEWTAD
jgi:hypothetical protein